MSYEVKPFQGCESITLEALKDQADSLLNMVTEEQRTLRVSTKDGEEVLLFPRNKGHERAVFLFFHAGSKKRRLRGSLFFFICNHVLHDFPNVCCKGKMKYFKTAGPVSIGSASPEKGKPISL